jgi:superfamily II DNA/RNA helicase
MASRPRWQDLVGLETIKTIVKKVLPTWTNGLHAIQLELVSGILDGRDILCCTATGDGKSAAFAIPCLVLLEYNNNPEEYPRGLPTRAKPIGVVITPTKGLASNIVRSFAPFSIYSSWLARSTN